MKPVRPEWGRAGKRPLLAMAVAAVTVGALLSVSGPSTADVTATRGEAFGYRASVSLFGGPANTRGPEPIVTLPATGATPPLTANAASGLVQFGPATIFSSGPITVSTGGILGPGGSVTSSTDITNVNRSGQEVFDADRLQSTCTATEAGVSGSTTVTNGTLRTSEGNPDVEGDDVVVAIPTNPPPNFTLNGTIEAVGDNFQAIFNEQTITSDGITVYALHLRLLGPTAVGDLFIGKSECGVTGTGIVTTTTSSSTTTQPSTTTTSTSTTLPPTTTTTRPATTTTSALGTCGGRNPTIVGTAGRDRIFGTAGPDVIASGAGRDTVLGLSGDDVICGGGANDTLVGGEGNDRLLGEAGNDTLLGQNGADDLSGGPGTDRLLGGRGADSLNGGPDADLCTGDRGIDTATACERTATVP